MRIFRHLSAAARQQAAGSILAIGIFDGFHLGHQKIIKKVRAKATSAGCSAGVLSFYPHPQQALNHQPIKMIQTLEQRLRAFEQAGLDFCLLLDLDRKLSSLSGEAFARQIIKDSLKVKEVVVGRNFRFGHRRQGGVEDLKRFGLLDGFKVTALEPAVRDGRPISSSLIRKLLEAGQVEKASQLLGHPYELSGRVVTGRQLGRELGYPTINLETKNDLLPPGVFISLTEIKGEVYPSVSNIGVRPTFGGKTVRVESHLLDVTQKVYGQPVSLLLIKKIRAEKKFSSLQALREALAGDINLARKFFNRMDCRSLIKARQLDF